MLFAEVFSEITSGSCSKSLSSFNKSRIWFTGIVQHFSQEERTFCPGDRQKCWPRSELGQFMVKTPQRELQLFLFLVWMKPLLQHDGKDLLRLITGRASIKMWNTDWAAFGSYCCQKSFLCGLDEVCSGILMFHLLKCLSQVKGAFSKIRVCVSMFNVRIHARMHICG